VRRSDTQSNGPRKSHFATLIGTGDVIPASQKRKTLTSLGTPNAALAPVEAAPDSAPRSTKVQPPITPGAAGLFDASSSPTKGPTSTSAVVARAKLNSITLGEVAQFRSWSAQRWGVAFAVVAGLGIVVGLIASASSDSSSEARQQPAAGLTPISAPVSAVLPGAEPMAAADDRPRGEPSPRAATEPGNNAPVSAPKELRAAPKAVAPAKPASMTKDYGI